MELTCECLERRSMLAGFQITSPTLATGTVSAEYLGPGKELFPPQKKTGTWNASGQLSPPSPGGGNSLSADSKGNSGSVSAFVVQAPTLTMISLSPSVLGWQGKASTQVVSGTGSTGTPVTLKIVPSAGDAEGGMVRVTLTSMAFGVGPVVDSAHSVSFRQPGATSFTTLTAGAFPQSSSTKTATFPSLVGDEFQLQFGANAQTTLNHGGNPASFFLSVSALATKLDPLLVVADNSTVKPDAQGRFWFTSDAAGKPLMPKMTFEIKDLPASLPKNLPVTWTTRVSLAAAASPGGKAVDGGTTTETTAGFVYTPNIKNLAGGDIDVSASFVFKGRTYTVSSEGNPQTKNLKVLGRNPSAAQINTLISGVGLVNWPAGSTFEAGRILRQIAFKESAKQQFTSEGYPKWNTKGDGGHGVMQLTPSNGVPIARENVWDWQANVRAGIKLFDQKLATGKSYAADTQGRSEFKNAVTQYNVNRNPVVVVTVPELTPDQRVLFAIRYYNGAAGTDSIGRPFRHEYELALDTVGLLDVALTPGNSARGTARWVQVPWRSRTAGDPNYVNNVLASPAN